MLLLLLLCNTSYALRFRFHFHVRFRFRFPSLPLSLRWWPPSKTWPRTAWGLWPSTAMTQRSSPSSKSSRACSEFFGAATTTTNVADGLQKQRREYFVKEFFFFFFNRKLVGRSRFLRFSKAAAEGYALRSWRQLAAATECLVFARLWNHLLMYYFSGQ